MTTETIKFVEGQTYSTRSIVNSDTVISITVERRTAKRLKTTDGKTLGIGIYEGVEYVQPWGRYSMAPIIRANDPKSFEKTKPEAPDTLASLMAEGEKLFSPEQFEEIKGMVNGLVGAAAYATTPTPTAKIYNFADYRKK